MREVDPGLGKYPKAKNEQFCVPANACGLNDFQRLTCVFRAGNGPEGAGWIWTIQAEICFVASRGFLLIGKGFGYSRVII
jgi:hypothetical protein